MVYTEGGAKINVGVANPNSLRMRTLCCLYFANEIESAVSDAFVSRR